jgi:hypothetical protein
MKFWQELKGRTATIANAIPFDSFETGQFFRERQERGNTNIFFQKKFLFSRRIFRLRGSQFFLQCYLFLDNSGN